MKRLKDYVCPDLYGLYVRNPAFEEGQSYEI